MGGETIELGALQTKRKKERKNIYLCLVTKRSACSTPSHNEKIESAACCRAETDGYFSVDLFEQKNRNACCTLLSPFSLKANLHSHSTLCKPTQISFPTSPLLSPPLPSSLLLLLLLLLLPLTVLLLLPLLLLLLLLPPPLLLLLLLLLLCCYCRCYYFRYCYYFCYCCYCLRYCYCYYFRYYYCCCCCCFCFCYYCCYRYCNGEQR